ncbi:MAG: DMT family transporter [Alphaproteobacteria bacterium]|nr:DMT family transporter [Alphaproteobacteria bacterium]
MSGFVESPESRQGRGIGLLLAACLGFGMAPTLARLAYDAGSDPRTAVLLRFTLAAMAVTLLLRHAGRPLRLPPAERRQAIAVGALSAAMSYGYLAAVAHIAVSVAALVFMTYPAFTAVAAHLLGQERLTGARVGALAAAFAGIAMVVGFDGGTGHSPAGLALAFAAALACAATIVWTSRLLRRADALVVNGHAMLTGAAIFLLVVALGGGPAWPGTALGWVGIVAAGLAYTTGIVCIFFAIGLLGPFRVAALGNLEPVVAVGFAMAVLGERIDPVQASGVALVLGALLALQIRERRG